MNILEQIENYYKQNLPFVVYKKPNETKISGLFQQSNALFYTRSYAESGFVFAPFDDKNKTVLIPESQSQFLEEEITFNEVVQPDNLLVTKNKGEEFHCKIVDKAVKKIIQNEFKKVVLSRREEVSLVNFNLVNTFKQLLNNYANAMVYVWFHPSVGLWLGATPETLVKIKQNKFETMSLAGTQVYTNAKQVVWQEKELDEQQVVTDYILSKLQPICKQVFAESTETVKAGNLLHLKTKIKGVIASQVHNLKQKELITRLHPTPAVCGFPKSNSKEFILQTENYDREFYTGFLGELNLPSSCNKLPETNLFVNLRCMQIKKSNALIYVGGGITKNSNPQKEWQETVAKTNTMKRVLK